MSAPVLPVDKFQSRDELVSFIEQQATTAVEKATRVERRVPWVTSGPVCADSAGYSVLKAAAYALGFVGPDQAKEEIHAHQQLRDLYAGYGFSPHHGQQSFLVPLASAHLPVFEPQGRKLRDELHQKLTANADRYDPDEADWIGRRLNPYRKALGTVTDTAGGTMVPLPMLGELIDLQRSLEVFATAGAREVALPPNGRIQFPKLTAASSAYWVGEGSAITESQPTTGNLDLQAKKLGVFVKLNNELLRFASPSAEGLVRLDMARAAALKADLAMLEGTGGTQIKGLITYSGISTHTASTTGTDGNTFTPADVALMESKLPDAVEAPTAWVLRKAMFAALMNRRADAVSAADGKGAFLFRDVRYASSGPPAELYGTRVVRSAQVSATRTKGSGTNLTYMLLGYFPDWRVSGKEKWPKRRRGIGLRNQHRVHGIHKRVRFPPDSVHDSVHSLCRHRRANGHLGRRNVARTSVAATQRLDWRRRDGPCEWPGGSARSCLTVQRVGLFCSDVEPWRQHREPEGAPTARTLRHVTGDGDRGPLSRLKPDYFIRKGRGRVRPLRFSDHDGAVTGALTHLRLEQLHVEKPESCMRRGVNRLAELLQPI